MGEKAPESVQPSNRTEIYKFTPYGEDHIGYVEANVIYKVRWESGIATGRVEQDSNTTRIFRKTHFDEKEVGSVNNEGAVYSSGLFEGGALGWVDHEGIVVQSGLILGEEEVGRVAGPSRLAAAAALLLIFLPEDAEESRKMTR